MDEVIGTYWDNKGKHSRLYDLLWDLVPEIVRIGDSDNYNLEVLRQMSNCYYDIFNNGGENLGSQIKNFFGFDVEHFIKEAGANLNWKDINDIVEPKMDKAILDTFIEQFNNGNLNDLIKSKDISIIQKSFILDRR